MIQAAGVSMAAGEWILAMRGTLFALSLGAIPFALLFIVTPLAKKAGLVVFGLLFFNTAWGVMDAVAARGAIDAAWLAFEDVRRANLGLDAILLMPEHSLRAAATFGSARTWAVSFAGLLTMALTGFGGYALSSMASHAQGKVEASGSAAAEKVGTPEGRVALEKSMQDSVGAEARLSGAMGAGSMAYGVASALSQHGSFSAVRSASEWGARQGMTPAQVQENIGAAAGPQAVAPFLAARALNTALGRPDTNGNVIQTAGEASQWERMVAGGNALGAARAAEAMTPRGGDPAATQMQLAAASALRSASDTTAYGDVVNDALARMNALNRAQGRPEASREDAALAVAGIQAAPLAGQVAASGASPEVMRSFHATQTGMSLGEQRGFLRTLGKLGVSLDRAMEAKGAMEGYRATGNAEALESFSPQELRAGATLQASEMGARGNAAMMMLQGGLATSLEKIARTNGAAAMGGAAAALGAGLATGISAEQIALGRDGAGGVNIAMNLNGEQFWDQNMQKTLEGVGWSREQVLSGMNALREAGRNGQGGGVLNLRVGADGSPAGASLAVANKVAVEQGTSVSGAPGVTKFDQASFEGAMAEAGKGNFGPLQGMLEGARENGATANMFNDQAGQWISRFGETSASDSDSNNTQAHMSSDAGKLLKRFPLLGALAEKAGVVGKGGLVDAGARQGWENRDEDKTSLKLSRAHVERIHEAAAEHAASQGPQGSDAYSDAYARFFHGNLQASYDYLRGQASESAEEERRLPETRDTSQPAARPPVEPLHTPILRGKKDLMGSDDEGDL